jgi:hypothetical protein
LASGFPILGADRGWGLRASGPADLRQSWHRRRPAEGLNYSNGLGYRSNKAASMRRQCHCRAAPLAAERSRIRQSGRPLAPLNVRLGPSASSVRQSQGAESSPLLWRQPFGGLVRISASHVVEQRLRVCSFGNRIMSTCYVRKIATRSLPSVGPFKWRPLGLSDWKCRFILQEDN